MTDLFLSYKAEDRPRVAPLVQALETDGLSVWWDAHIGAGDEWRDTILRHLEAARGVLVVWSRRSIGPHGQFVRDEATRAVKRGTYFPVCIDKVDPPLGFGETQALDLTGWKGDRSDLRYQAVLSALRKRLGIKAAPVTPVHPNERVISRRGVIAAGAVAAASLAGLGAWFLASPESKNADRIAVLPFANLSGDPDQAYFSDGIAEELRGALSRIGALKVVARTSSEAVRDDDARTAARKLGVDNILTGSVRRTPTMIRVSAQLIDGHRNVERWSEIYDRPPGDALQIQTDIAFKVAQALSIELGEKGRRALAAGGTQVAAAQDLLLKALEVATRDDSAEGLQRALGMADSAIALDPEYADAYAAKSVILTTMAGTTATSSIRARDEMFDLAEQLARRAIALAPASAQPYGALGSLFISQLKMRPALSQFATMASLPGGEARADFNSVDTYAYVLGMTGQTAAAIARAEQMVARDPLNPFAFHTMAVVLGQARRYREAERYGRRAIALAPDLNWPRAFRGFFLMQSGDLDAASAEFARLGDAPGVWLAWEAVLAERRGNRAESNRILRELRSWGGDAAHYQYAEVYAQQHRKEEAIAALESAWAALDPGLAIMKVDPLLDPLRGDPRFKALENRLDFPA